MSLMRTQMQQSNIKMSVAHVYPSFLIRHMMSNKGLIILALATNSRLSLSNKTEYDFKTNIVIP
jgi:hypothetical protein